MLAATNDEAIGCQTAERTGDVQTDSPIDPTDFDEPYEFSDDEAEPRSTAPLILWMGVLGLVVLFIPLYLTSNTLAGEVVRLESEVFPLQTAVAATPGLPPEAGPLIITLTAVHNQSSQIDTLLPTLAAANVDWPGALSAVNNVDRNQIQITSLEQSGSQLLIRGRAISDDVVTTYARQLEGTGKFAAVEVQSIVQAPEPFFSPTPTAPLPTATPTTAVTNTPVPTAVPTKVPVTPKPTATATPKLTDDFEWDDAHANPIFVGAPPQAHNFYPNFDVDCVIFLAKAGRTYEVSTDFLAPGVDTFLTVTFGDVSLTNDDAELGTLSSSVTLQAPPDIDIEVSVQVSNRGVYGADKWYDLQVVEIVPTTPTPTITPTKGPPTITPSPTTDLRDIHEPNDVDPNPIAIGEAQIHNFYPNGDVDKVGLLVKNGRFYQIVTSQLAVGVDTAVSVNFNGQTWQNDDYDLPGSGNLASAVCFPAQADGTAVATISNVGQQFGGNKTYVVSAQEVPFLTVQPETINFGTATQGGSNPPAQTVQIEGTEPLVWQFSTETPWLSAAVITGTTPSSLSLTAHIAGLAPGVHEGEFTLGWADFCRQTVPVSVKIDPVTSSLPGGDGRFLPAAKFALRQSETIEFVILVTLLPVPVEP
ncbi:MAG: PilN domain-containing protein [Anaerolineaceae bacterium]|nr:PilN domain-containing protein [Anaerolineaceae bacterium]